MKVYDKRTLSNQEKKIMRKEVHIISYIQEQCCHQRSSYQQQRNIPGSGLSKLIEAIEESNHLYIVTEYVPGGNLLSRIVQNYPNNWTEYKVKEIAFRILRGIQNLHSMGILHGDIEPQNILIDSEDDSITIIDFGCAAQTSTQRKQQQNCNIAYCDKDYSDTHSDSHYFDDDFNRSSILRFSNIAYTAPEILRGYNYDTQSDMWSLGVTLYFCLFGTCPFTTKKVEAVNNTELLTAMSVSHSNRIVTSNGSRDRCHVSRYRLSQKNRNTDYTFTNQNWNRISRHAKQFISSLLHVDPSVRMTPEEALQHKWLQKTSSFSSSQSFSLSNLNIQFFRSSSY